MPLKNKEERKEYDRRYREADKDGLYTVYYIKEEHYAGMTCNLRHRLRHHKNVY